MNFPGYEVGGKWGKSPTWKVTVTFQTYRFPLWWRWQADPGLSVPVWSSFASCTHLFVLLGWEEGWLCGSVALCVWLCVCVAVCWQDSAALELSINIRDEIQTTVADRAFNECVFCCSSQTDPVNVNICPRADTPRSLQSGAGLT